MPANLRDSRAGASSVSCVARRTIFAAAFALFAATGAVAQTPEPAQPAESRFDVMEYRVLGNTVLARQAIENAVYPHLGEQRTLEDVENARLALEQAYRAAGYGTVFVDIPEQDVDQGIVRLKVTEGRLNRVRVENARYFSARRIREALPSATPATVPSLPTLQKEIAALNTETPDRAIVPVLAAGSTPGTVDLTLKVDDELPLHGSIEVNNQYTADTTRLRVASAIRYDNLFDRFDSLSLQYQTAPKEPSEFGVFAANFVHRLNEGAGQLALYYVHSDSDVASLGTMSVLGKGQVFGGKWIVPITNTAATSHTVNLGLDYKDFLESILLDPEESFQTPISYLNISLGESSVWRTPRQEWSLGASANLGIRGLSNDVGEFADKRFKARPNYFYVRGEASSRTVLPGQFTVLVRLSGQYAIEPVIGNEQFAIGGSDGVRGYLEAEELGDYGFKGTLQLGAPPWQMAAGAFRLEGFAFVDAGVVAILDPLPEQPGRADLSSWGLGMNIAAFESMLASLSWAQTFVPGGRTEAHEGRLHFTLQWAW